MTLDEVAAELYGVPPARFVAMRTERARQARDAGNKPLATEIAALRRPTVSAWALNLLTRAAPADLTALLQLADALRDAQRRLAADQLRALTTQRQQVITTVVRRITDLAAAEGQRLSDTVQREVGTTLQAALADPDVAEQLRTGTLTTAATYDGFGPATLTSVPRRDEKPASASKPAAVPTSGAASPDAPAGSPEPPPDPRAEARRQLEELRPTLESARAALTSAERTHTRTAAALAALDSRIATLRADLSDAESQRRFAASAAQTAARTFREARATLDSLEHRAAQTERDLDAE
ncbi:hypothetical protein [Nocardia sp. NBC_00511]|uniref:hypothetical protein n=1 Tax=Nocardia sp. NBC_00511 TaxID=2903591 RepID=UPI0030E30CED